MTRTIPPTLRRTLSSSAPWLVALGFGALAHASYWLSSDSRVHVVTMPIPAPVVHVDSSDAQCPEPAAVEREHPRPTAQGRITPKVGGSWLAAVDATEGVRCDPEGLCTISRTFVRGMMAANPLPHSGARVVPSVQDGEVMGLKLYGVRKKSLLGAMGLESGDLVMTIDDRPLRSMDDTMAAYTRLVDADSFSLDVVRGGRAMKKHYRVE